MQDVSVQLIFWCYMFKGYFFPLFGFRDWDFQLCTLYKWALCFLKQLASHNCHACESEKQACVVQCFQACVRRHYLPMAARGEGEREEKKGRKKKKRGFNSRLQRSRATLHWSPQTAPSLSCIPRSRWSIDGIVFLYKHLTSDLLFVLFLSLNSHDQTNL